MTEIADILQSFSPITLAQMEDVKLMNRIDTKFAVHIRQLPAILEKAQAQYFAQEIDGKRIATYDTMYYDTDDCDMYIRHQNKQLVRQKIRIRQYVDSNLTFLEIKRKNNKGRTKKKRIALTVVSPDGKTMGTNKKGSISVEEFVATKSRYTWSELTPHLRTSFERITLVNKNKTERLTIDMHLVWSNCVTGQEKTFDNLVIIELKRDGNVPSPMIGILDGEHVHPFKISKYCIGTALTNPTIKQNRFKPKIKRIEKMVNDEVKAQ